MTVSILTWRRSISRWKNFVEREFSYRRLSRILKRGNFPSRREATTISKPVNGQYLVTTEKGIYWLSGDRFVNLFPFDTFGISVEGGQVFFACWLVDCVFVMRGDLVASGEVGRIENLVCLYSDELTLASGRIHQLHARNGVLALACCKRNSILRLDCQSGAVIDEIFPVCDATGFPVGCDQNHLNSVYQCGEVTFFLLPNGGGYSSLVGYLTDSEVVTALHPHRGLHDIVPTTRGLIFSDTFGSPRTDHLHGGALHYGKRILSPGAGEDKGYMVRGVAGTGEELLVGHSHHGRRQDRFKGQGGLLVFKGDEFERFERVPFAQVNDIIRVDGRKTDYDLDDVSPSDAEKLLVEALGDIAYRSDTYYRQLPNEWHMRRCGQGRPDSVEAPAPA